MRDPGELFLREPFGASGGGGGRAAISRPNIYLPDGALDVWNAAKAAAAPAQLVVLGDSIEAGNTGAGLTSYTQSWQEALRSYFTAQIGSFADYYINGQSPILGSPSDSPWGAALNGAGWTSTAQWLGSHNILYINAAFANWAQRFTTPYACTALDLWYVDSYPGTWQYRVDGGTGQIVTNTSAASSAATTVLSKIAISGLANTIHTLDIGQSSANACCMPLGITTYVPGASAGLAFARMGVSGQQALHLLSGTSANAMPADRCRLFQGPGPMRDSGSGVTTGFPYQPHLLIIGLGVNDVHNASGATNLRDLGRRLAQAARAAHDNASIVFVVHCVPDNVNSDAAGTSTANDQNWNQYFDYAYQAARQFNCAVVNIHSRWGETPVGKGFLANGVWVHPTIAGHADIFSALKMIL